MTETPENYMGAEPLPVAPSLPSAPRHVVLDLETLGRKPGAVLVSIVAVWFDEEMAEHEFGGQFYTRVDAVSCEQLGLRMDAETVMWWMAQNEEARQELFLCARGFGADLKGAMESFVQWFPKGVSGVWGYGSDFDNAMMEAAGLACGVPVPWSWRQNRCLRTLAAVFPEVKRAPILPGEPAHHALHDARRQAAHLQRILKVRSVDVPRLF